MAHQGRFITTIVPLLESQMISSINCTPLYLNEEFLRQKYLTEKLSTSEISRLIFSARSTVKCALVRFGIQLRSTTEAKRLNKGQLAYGERWLKGDIVASPKEQRVLDEMRRLRHDGNSYGQIAQWLNSSRIPTKNRAKAWDRPTVYKILKNCEKRLNALNNGLSS